MTDVTLQNPIVTAVQAIKSGSDVAPVSSSNPLPSELFLRRNGLPQTHSHDNPIYTVSSRGSAGLSLVLSKESLFLVHGATVAAGGVGKYPKMQVWNPSDSGKEVIVYVFQMWNTLGTVTYQASYSNTALSVTETAKPKQNVFAGSSVAATAKVFVDNTQSTLATNILTSVAVSAVAPNGTNILTVIQGVLKAGQGLTIEGLTANAAMNAFIVFGEIDPL